MGKKPRSRMPLSQRAKQFAPFKSLGGDLDTALKRAEEEHRREIESGSITYVDVQEAGAPEYEIQNGSPDNCRLQPDDSR